MRRIALFVPMLFVLLVIGPPALARASHTHVSFTETTVSVTPPSRQWVSAAVLHFRGAVEVTKVTGDLEGGITAVLNGNINLHTGTGAVFGPFTFVTSTVTWSGSFRGDPSGSGTFIAQGSDGSKIHGSFVPSGPDTLEIEAVILSPKG
jgi:hypothetical protein